MLVAQLEPDAIRARIRQARLEADLTQQDLADLIERHKRTVENYENVRVPEWAELTKIARVLDRQIEWFLYGDRPEPPGLTEVNEQLTELRRLVELLDRKLDRLDVEGRLAAIDERLRDLVGRLGERV